MLTVERLEPRDLCDVAPLTGTMPLIGPVGGVNAPSYLVAPVLAVQPAVSVPYTGMTITFYPPLPVPQLTLNLPYEMPRAE